MAPKKPMDPWLLKHLETKTGGFRAAKWERCGTCEELILAGMDGDIAAPQVRVDPTPLTPLQEGLCAIAGRRTASLEIVGRSKITIHDRDPYAIGRPFQQPVVPHHRCGARFPGFIHRRPAGTQQNTEPPF